MQGHLMRYPVVVGGDGTAWPLMGHEFFPDVAYLLIPLRSNIMFTQKKEMGFAAIEITVEGGAVGGALFMSKVVAGMVTIVVARPGGA